MKTKKLILNIAMVIIIVLLAVLGIFFVNSIKNSKGAGELNQAGVFGTVAATKGNVRIERNGIGYTLKPDTIIINNDKLSTLSKSTIELSLNEASVVTLDESTKLAVTAVEGTDGKEYKIYEGNIFINVKADEAITFSYGKGQLSFLEAVLSVNVHDGIPGINVYSGMAELVSDKGERLEIKKGEYAFLNSSGGIETASFSADSMSEFNIKQAKQVQEKFGISLCFTNDAMESILTKRADTIEKAFREKELRRQELLAEGSQEVIVRLDDTSNGDVQGEAASNKAVSDSAVSDKAASAGSTESVSDKTSAIKLEIETESSNDTSSNKSGSSENEADSDTSKETKIKTATIAISCRTLLSNMDKLTPGKDIYVPDDGQILSAVTVEFKEGDTVFDVLKRVCSSRKIQLEYSWSPIYNSNYIEGINHLYEFDGGDGSGWTYEVNGWRPNYGVSACKLKDGDYISFDYTCDMGSDLGSAIS